MYDVRSSLARYHTIVIGIWILGNIWNPIHLDRIRQKSTYLDVLVRTSKYWYRPVRASTYQYQYILVRTGTYKKHDLRGSHTNSGSAPRVNCNSVHFPCMRYDRMMSKFKKCKSSGKESTYWYVLVRTGTYRNRHQPHPHFISMLRSPLSYAGKSPLHA